MPVKIEKQQDGSDKATMKTTGHDKYTSVTKLVRAKKMQPTAHHDTMALLPKELQKMREQLSQVLDARPVKVKVDWRWMFGAVLMGCASMAMIREIFYSTLNNKNIAVKHLTFAKPSALKSATDAINTEIDGQKQQWNNLPFLGQTGQHVVKSSNVPTSMLTETMRR